MVRGKGNKPRIVFLSPESKSALQRYLKKRKDNSEFIFVSHGSNKGEEGLTPRTVQRIIQKYATMAGIVGATYGIAVPAPAVAQAVAAANVAQAGTQAPTVAPATVVLPYVLPAWAGAKGAPVTVTVASIAPNWLGRNGHPLRCAVYYSPAGTVTVQPHAKGVQVNAYPAGMRGCGITAHSMAQATQAPAS